MWKMPVTVDTRSKYGIVCPADSDTSTLATDTKLKFTAWDFPFFIGAKADPGLLELGFIWSSNGG